MKKTSLYFIPILFIALFGRAQNPVFVKDFNPGAADAIQSWGTHFVQVNDKIFVSVSTSTDKTDLYVIKNEEPVFIKTICGGCNPPSTLLLKHNDAVIFTAKENNNTQLWVSDGTTENTLLLATLDSSPQYMLVGNNGKAYIATQSSLYLSDGSAAGTKKLNADPLDFARHLDNNDDKIFSVFKNGIAFLTNKFGEGKIQYADEMISELASFDAGSSFTDLSGLCEVAGGLVFAVEDDGVYHYHATTGVKKTSFKEPLRIFELNGAAVHYHYGDGLTLLHDFPLKSTSLIKKYGFTVQTEELPRSVVGDKMVIYIDDYNSFDNLIILIDKVTKKATDLGEISPYPSNMVSYNENIFFFDGTFNGFSPSLYHLKGNLDKINKVKSLSFNSNSGPSVLPLGIQNSSLFFLSNLDATKGRELYKISTSISTSTENLSDGVGFNLNIKNNEATIITNTNSESFDLMVFDLSGKLLFNRFVNAGVPQLLPEWKSNVIITVIDKKSGKMLTKHVFMP